jgi:hypothetical protein
MLASFKASCIFNPLRKVGTMYVYKSEDGHKVKFIKPVSCKTQKILGFKNIPQKRKGK